MLSIITNLREGAFHHSGITASSGAQSIGAFTPYIRDGGNPSSTTALLESPPEIAAFGGEFKSDSGHTEWVDARVHQTGFTTTFSPNTQVPYAVNGKTFDIDYNSTREGRSATLPTYAVVTSRGHHQGGVNSLKMDGSVDFISNAIDKLVWEALGTRAGGEVVGDH